jgi:signal transduction histidine kinase
MRLTTRISLVLGLLMVMVAALLLYHVRTIREAVSTSFELSELSARVKLSATDQLTRLNQMEENAGKYRVTRDLGYLERFEELVADFDAGLARLRAAPLTPDEAAEAERLDAVWRDFLPLAAALREGTRAPAAADPLEPVPELGAPLATLRLRTRRAGDASQAVMASRLARSAETARRVERLSWSAAAGALLLSVLVSALLVRSVSGSLRRLQAGTHAVAEGDFEHRLDTDGADEFAEVARDFNVMTRRLAELDQMKRDFLSKVSHDLKTPLASMQETTRALLDGVSGPLEPTQRRLLQLSQESGTRLAAMIGNILDLSSMEAGAARLTPAPHALAPLLHAAAAQVAAVAAEGGVRLSVEAPDDARLECDADRVLQALVNLLENAVKFSPRDGTVSLRAVATSDRPDAVPAARWRGVDAGPRPGALAWITVTDEGPGVPSDERERVFERFYQGEPGRRARRRGVGLGLPICREIAAAHGGRVWADARPGGGSVFHLLLPGAVQAARLDPEPATPALR